MGCGQSTQSSDSSAFEWEEDSKDSKEPTPPPPAAMCRKRQSVSAECYTPNAEIKVKVVQKSAEDAASIKSLISQNILFNALDEEQLETVVAAFEKKDFAAGSVVISQGDKVADWYYVLSSGSAKAAVDGEVVKEYEKGGAFGELALLYNAPRAATVTAATDISTWALDRTTFRSIVVDSNAKRRRDYEDFLSAVPILTTLDEMERSCIADVLEPVYHAAGDIVIKEGDAGEAFFIVEEGTAEGYAAAAPDEKLPYKRGDYFGELALLTEKPRKATVVATSRLKVAQMDAAAFKRLLGKTEDLLKRNADKYAKFKAEADAA